MVPKKHLFRIIMYARKQKKTFEPGTFIPTTARVVAIIHLCLAFTILAWNASLPFSGELFSIKSRILLYKYVMGIEDQKELSSERLSRNANRFNALAEDQKTFLINGYNQLRKLNERTFFVKLQRSAEILAFGIPSFEQAWILFSIIIPILLLKKVKGSVQVIWILPLLALLYAVDNRWNGISPKMDEERQLFPSETYLVENYLSKPLTSNFLEQKNELELAWKRYLIAEWAHESPRTENTAFALQVEKGEHAFNLARIAALSPFNHPLYSQLRNQESLLILALYLFWNFFFAIIVWKVRNQIFPPDILCQEA